MDSCQNEETDVEKDETALKPKLAANIEKARTAMARLEEIFEGNPTLQTTTIMKQLMDVYKDCKKLDKLMGTSLFDKENFDGLIEKLRDFLKYPQMNHQQALQEQVTRLFSVTSQDETSKDGETTIHNGEFPHFCEALKTETSVVNDKEEQASVDLAENLGENIKTLECNLINRSSENSGNNNEYNIFNENEVSKMLKLMGNDSTLGSTLVNSVDGVEDKGKANSDGTTITEDYTKKNEITTNRTCSRLCSLIKAQLVKSHKEVTMRYGGQAAAFTQDDLKQGPGEEEADLDEIMSQVLVQQQSPEFKHFMQKLDEHTAKEREESNGQTEEKPKLSQGVSDYDISAALHGTPEQKKQQENETKARFDSGCNSMGKFLMVESAPNQHKFKLAVFQPNDPKNFIKFVRKELQLLRSSLPNGIYVKGFEDRMDLYSVMIQGPEKTPYEDGLFFFDFQLPSDYPKAPPLVHYVSYVADKLNPNLYEDGKVCVSLLGTWSGKGTETWTPNSNILQLLVSIQGLILVSEPYYNEAGYERQKGTQQGQENSRMYNELAVLKMTQSLNVIAKKPPMVFKDEIMDHLENRSDNLVRRLESWLDLSQYQINLTTNADIAKSSKDLDSPNPKIATKEKIGEPDFPLLPGSKGFCISLKKAINTFKETMYEIKLKNTETKS